MRRLALHHGLDWRYTRRRKGVGRLGTTAVAAHRQHDNQRKNDDDGRRGQQTVSLAMIHQFDLHVTILDGLDIKDRRGRQRALLVFGLQTVQLLLILRQLNLHSRQPCRRLLGVGLGDFGLEIGGQRGLPDRLGCGRGRLIAGQSIPRGLNLIGQGGTLLISQTLLRRFNNRVLLLAHLHAQRSHLLTNGFDLIGWVAGGIDQDIQVTARRGAAFQPIP